MTAQRAEKEQQSRLEEEQRIIRQLREIRRKNGLTEALTRVLKEGY